MKWIDLGFYAANVARREPIVAFVATKTLQDLGVHVTKALIMDSHAHNAVPCC